MDGNLQGLPQTWMTRENFGDFVDETDAADDLNDETFGGGEGWDEPDPVRIRPCIYFPHRTSF